MNCTLILEIVTTGRAQVSLIDRAMAQPMMTSHARTRRTNPPSEGRRPQALAAADQFPLEPTCFTAPLPLERIKFPEVFGVLDIELR
jgi:hypothetical protein